MADGTYKLVDDIELGDMVLTWSFEEGKYVENCRSNDEETAKRVYRISFKIV